MKSRIKLSSFTSGVVAGIAGITSSAVIMLLLSYTPPGRAVSDTKLTAVTGSQTLQELLDSFSVQYFQSLLPSAQVGPGLPIRLKIPVIRVDAAFEYVGLTADGAMDVPKSRDGAAWFQLGARPGEIGTAVIAGHFGRKDGKGSVFDNLHKLRKGDKIYVEDDKGVTISFVVTDARRYDPEADASDVFGSNDGKAHLNLITCEGVWDKRANQYPARLVVFTDEFVVQ